MSAPAFTGPTLVIDKCGGWYVARPHYTGVDIGPAYHRTRGEVVPSKDVQLQIDFYKRAGFEIRDARDALARVAP